MSKRQRLINNIAGSLAQVSREDVILRSIENFRKADAEFGQRLADARAVRRGVVAASGARIPVKGREELRTEEKRERAGRTILEK